MQGVSSIFELFQRYFQYDIITIIVIAFLPWLLKKFSKKQKLFLSGILLFTVLFFNGAVFWLMEKLGEEETYYRILWILPFPCVFACAVIKVWEKLKHNGQKAAFVLLAVMMVFLYSNVLWDNWKPDNLYYLSEETMQLADIIREDSNDTRVNLFDYSDLTYGIRQYNAKLVLVDDGVENALYNMIYYNMDIGEIIVASIVRNNQIEYIYFEKTQENAQKAVEDVGAYYVGETEEHYIYRFDLEEIEQKFFQ